MRGRILLNLVAFAVLGVALCVWAVTSLITVDALSKPVSVSAEFTSSPGLRSDLEVAYLGVTIGAVRDVKLAPGKVVVSMQIDRDTEVPSDAVAEVARKSAIGEPYIALSPSARSRPAVRPLRNGDRIPLARTRVAVDYKRVFEGAGRLLSAVPPEDTRTILRELAIGLNGRGSTLRDVVGDTHQLTGTLAGNARLLDELSVRLTRLTAVLADGGPELAGGLDSLAAFSAALDERSADLDSFLDRGPRFLDRTLELLEKSRPGLSCLLNAVAVPGPSLFDPRAAAALDHALGLFVTTVPTALKDVTVRTRNGLYARSALVITVGDGPPAAEEYPAPLKDPRPPRLYYCTRAYRSAADLSKEAGRTVRRDGGISPGTAGSFTGLPAPATTVSAPGTRGSAPGRWLPAVPVVVAAMVLGLSAGRAVRVMRQVRR